MIIKKYPEEKELTKAEYMRLCRTAEKKHNERLCLILQTICGTGIRVSELQFITAEAARKGEAVVSLKGKQGAFSLFVSCRRSCFVISPGSISRRVRFSSPEPGNR